MRMKKLDEHSQRYLLRVYNQYTEKKLTYHEEVQLFQDLVDTGLYLQMGEEVIALVRRLILVQLIQPAVKIVWSNESSH